MNKDLKTRTEGYAHSYPFAKVSDAYIAGAKGMYNDLTQWHNPKDLLPPNDVEVLCMVHQRFQTYAILRRGVEGWWQPIYPSSATPDGGWIAFEGEVFAWREIYE